MSTRIPPDPVILARGDAELQAELAGLAQRAAASLARLETSLASDVTVPLAAAVGRASEAHARLMGEAGLDGEADGPEGGEAPSWPALRRYREGVAREVVAPLREALDSQSPGTRVSEIYEAFLHGYQDSATGLATEIVRAEPDDTFVRHEDDGAWRRFVKAWVRGARILSRGRVREQRIPLLLVAGRIHRAEALPGVLDLHETLQLHYAEPIQGLERALGLWLRGWFPREDEAHNPEAHLSDELASELGAVRAAMAPILAELAGPAAPRASTPAPGGDTADDAEREGETEGAVAESDAPPPAPTARRVAREFQDALAATAAGLTAPEDALAEVRESLDIAAEWLDEDVRDAGTVLARTDARGEERRLANLRERLRRRINLWAGWHRAVAGRAALTSEILVLRGHVDGILDRLLEQVLRASVLHLAGTLREARDGLVGLARQASDPGSDLQSSRDRKAVARATEDLLSAAEVILEGRVTGPSAAESMDARVRAAADSAAESVAERLKSLPESADVHAVRDSVAALDPAQPVRPVRPQEIYRQALDVLHLESFRTSPAVLLTALEEARAECRDIPKVVEYNLTAARNELLSDEEKGDDAVLEDSRQLAVQGLERSARALDQVVAELLPAWDEFTERGHGVLHRALVQAHDRITLERAVQEQFADIRSLVNAQFRRARENLLKLEGFLRRQGLHAWRRAEVTVQRIVRRGRLALGAQPVAEGEAERTMEVLRSVSALLEPLPLVYRRLFSFQPVTDPSLLVGREDETAWVGRRWDAWRDGMRTPSLLTGPLTVGHTSFFNVLAASLFRDAQVVRLNFPSRCRTEEALADRIAQELRSADVLDQEEDGWSLDRLSRFLLERPVDPERALVILVEQLPHLFLRVPGGMELAERFLEFQARTSQSVFWLSSTSDPMWKLLTKVSPRAAALMTVGSLSAVDRDDMERILMVRHQRSGVPLEFLAPQDANPLLRRKLQKARTEEERYTILKAEFFDRLYRASQANIPMAILLWIKSADFTTQEGWLQLKPPRPIRFSFLEELDLGLDFALKALLEHGSLTLEEYTRIFAAPADDAFQAMEALRGRSLLERLEGAGGLPRPVDRIQDGVRYRVPPLLSQVVSQYLRNHNIFH